jgi:hypothetical protein
MMTVAVFGELALIVPALAEAQQVVRLGAVRRRCDDLMACPADWTILVVHLRFCAARTVDEIPVPRGVF